MAAQMACAAGMTHEVVEHATRLPLDAVKSVRSDPPRQQPAGDAHAGPHLAGEVLLAQLLLAALVASDLGGRPRLGHGLCPSRSWLGLAARFLLGLRVCGRPPLAGLPIPGLAARVLLGLRICGRPPLAGLATCLLQV